MAIPITAVDEQQNLLMIDLASLGEELNLVKIIDPAGTVTKLKTKSSMTVTFDYSNSTLVFDVESHMIPVDASPFDSSVPETIITARWYLNHSLSADPLFEPREATEGVGFFMTQRAQRPKINRRPVPSRPIKYFIKNVPAEFQAGFAMAFDEWNTHLENILGRKLLSYEFIDVTDPRSTLLVTGDIRYNIIELDLVNVAQYGGLGPSIANQLTGEILSGNVLVQGPKIVTAYKKWFDVSEAARSLRSSGSHMEADRILLMTSRQIQEEFKKLEVATYDLSIGKLSFQIPSQLPPLQDPITQREDFEELPTGFSFQAYMKDYFSDLLAHELGHNLGLRHNFRGSLSGSELPAPGEVSHSVMEYLGRTHRHLNRVGVYDIMAIKYGYMNIKPDRTDFFCTDENVPDLNQKGSAECSRDDASKDPFNFFENRLAKASYLLVGRGSSSPPEWTVPDMQRELDAVLKGMALYASTAESTSKHWTNFFSNPDRPSTPNEIIGYVLGKIRRYLCNPEFETIIESKESEEGKKKTRGNIELLRARAATLILPLKVFSETDLSCR